MRQDGRTFDEHRPVEMITGFHRNAEGSVLYRAGGTVVLCTASIDKSVPAWLLGKGKGWLTAEYQMHPRANKGKREGREGRSGKSVSGRTQEIQRLIGRALRAAVNLEALGERTIALDCDVLEADGGTRTASVTGSFVALALALHKASQDGILLSPVLVDQVAALSVGHLNEGLALDLVYTEDSQARVDMNVVATSSGGIVEVQGTAEGEAVPRADIDKMMDLAMVGIASLVQCQRRAIEAAKVDLAALFAEGRFA